jgi:hypothetical protein
MPVLLLVVKANTMAPPIPVSENVGYGLVYDKAKAMEEIAQELEAKKKARKEEDEDKSVDSHPSETEWLIPQWEEFLKKEEKKKTEQVVIVDVAKECRFCIKTPCVLNYEFFTELMSMAEGLDGASCDQQREKI